MRGTTTLIIFDGIMDTFWNNPDYHQRKGPINNLSDFLSQKNLLKHIAENGVWYTHNHTICESAFVRVCT